MRPGDVRVSSPGDGVYLLVAERPREDGTPAFLVLTLAPDHGELFDQPLAVLGERWLLKWTKPFPEEGEWTPEPW